MSGVQIRHLKTLDATFIFQTNPYDYGKIAREKFRAIFLLGKFRRDKGLEFGKTIDLRIWQLKNK